MAAILNISSGTVRIHLANIYCKLGVENRTAAAMMAMEALGRGVAETISPQAR